jgi:phenylpyruvate tautomerase PptA (4-oxalocrotonate tautomerase family)
VFGLLRKKREWKADRLASKSVTDVLAKAMENADKMRTVVVIYDTPEDAEYPGGIFVQEDTTLSSILWMLEQAKKWIVD